MLGSEIKPEKNEESSISLRTIYRFMQGLRTEQPDVDEALIIASIQKVYGDLGIELYSQIKPVEEVVKSIETDNESELLHQLAEIDNSYVAIWLDMTTDN